MSSRPHSFSALLAFGCALLLLVPAHADVLVCGRKLLEGEIISENDKEIVIRLTSGQEQKVRRRRVTEIVRGQDTETYLRERTSQASEDAGALMELAGLAVAAGRRDLAEDAYRQVLAIDPAHRRAGNALRWTLIDGVYVDPGELPERPAATVVAKNSGPLIDCTIDERIEGILWKDWLIRHPNPKYDSPIGDQLAGTLFYHGHEWNLAQGNSRKQAPYEASISLQATKGETTRFFGAHDTQTFYSVEVTIEVTRRADGKRVLWCKSTADQGHHDDSDAVRNSFLKACNNIVSDEAVKKSPLWADPAKAPAQKEVIKISEKNK